MSRSVQPLAGVEVKLRMIQKAGLATFVETPSIIKTLLELVMFWNQFRTERRTATSFPSLSSPSRSRHERQAFPE
ncbi:hypothetical protein KCU59_g43, partial [Aureobasidium melanogenum]